METDTESTPRPARRSSQDMDVIVTSHAQRVFIFDPVTERARAWLAEKVPSEYHDSDGKVVAGPLKAAQLAMWLALDGLHIR